MPMDNRKKRKINYAEVESDVDLDEKVRLWERSEKQRKKNKTQSDKRAEKRRKRQAERSQRQAESIRRTHEFFGWNFTGTGCEEKKIVAPAPQATESSPFTADLLLKFPFDLFAEVCSNLEVEELITLAKVNKSFRKILLARSARSIWSASRKALGLPIPEGIAELDFALLFFGTACQDCGKTLRHMHRYLDVYLRLRCCWNCHCQNVEYEYPNAEPQLWTLSHLRHDGSSYAVKDALAITIAKKDIEARAQLDAVRSGTDVHLTRAQRHNAIEKAVERAFGDFLEARRLWVIREQSISEELKVIEERIKQLETERQAAEAAVKAREAAEERQKRQDEKDRQEKVLLDIYGWMHSEISYMNSWRGGKITRPEESPDLAQAQWTTYHEKIQNLVAAEAKKRERVDRLRAVEPYYDSLRDAYELDVTKSSLFPGFYEFRNFRSVTPLWKPALAVLDDTTWQQARVQIESDIESYAQLVQIEAIRMITAAHRDVLLSALSKHPSDYDLSRYDESFFSLATSAFCEYTPRHRSVTFRTYEETISQPGTWDIYRFRRSASTGNKQVQTIRTVLEAADLDPDTAKLSELLALDGDFEWKNDPRKKKRAQKIRYDVNGILYELLEHGPTIAQYRSGEKVELKYRRNDEDDTEEEDDLTEPESD